MVMSQDVMPITGQCCECSADKKRKRKYAVSEKGRTLARQRQKRFQERITAKNGIPFTQWFWSKYPQAKIHSRLNSRISAAFKRGRSSKSIKTTELLGCPIAQAMDWLEAQFLPGMSWDNHGEWHIDHIRPCASFDLTDPEQQKQCFHYSNLQPLWAKDNLSKSDKWEAAA